jgi:hypothetical protein
MVPFSKCVIKPRLKKLNNYILPSFEECENAHKLFKS